MKAKQPEQSLTRQRERGSALAVALIFLLLMTLLGISAMRGSNMQERMAGNLRDRNLAFQASEAALRGGETWLLNIVNQQTADLNAQMLNPAAWDGAAPAPTGSVAALDGQLASDPEFYVGPPSLRRVGIQLPPDFRRIYPVTARGEGGSDNAVVVLQSTFEPPQ
ncbi:MAG TPA: PilX N-terminal domain-containing pilus assembly protein [Gammaproteobacteria bacterium]|nr:PilX N-terminal domain-containing pilus assembly protein [Gammaproteobacteria bacterium]HRP87404.1 PilX N-terminal domain-containing pilus assembly protein [Gammaproteobacteria bacterium]